MRIIRNLTIILSIAFSSASVFAQENRSDEVLKKVSKNLNNIDVLSYDLTREVNYSSDDYKAISNWNCYYSFGSDENIIGLKFQITNPIGTEIYNGTEFFTLNNEDVTYELKNFLKKEDFSNKSYFYNSILTLRNILPSIIADKNIRKIVSDTLIGNKTFHQIRIDLGNRIIQNLGEDYDKIDANKNFIYTILTDQKSYLPREIKQTNNLNGDFVKTTFENLDLQPNIRPENTWFYSSYLTAYKEAVAQSKTTLPLGTKAPNWELKSLIDKKNIRLTDLKGKVIVLDFWIRNCSNCIANIPYINNLNKKFKNENFALFGINPYDSPDKIEDFSKKYNVNYPVLINGEVIAKNYGVYAYPTLLIIDKNGKIIYNENENSDRNAIEQTIINALK